MGTLIAMARGIRGVENLADHTYVKCAPGTKEWGCWGGKSGGRQIGKGAGSTERADKIAGTDERGGITCYLVNGVCHQAANRILLPTNGVLVTKAKGYAISSALYGPFGRVGHWPCRAPLHQHKKVKGDLEACRPKAMLKRRAGRALTADEKLDWVYAQEALALYAKAPKLAMAAGVTGSTQDFQVELFMHMARFHMGRMMDGRLARSLRSARAQVERRFSSAIAKPAFAASPASPGSLAQDVDKIAVQLQDRLGSILTPEQYETLLGVKRGEYVLLADPTIVKKLERKQ